MNHAAGARLLECARELAVLGELIAGAGGLALVEGFVRQPRMITSPRGPRIHAVSEILRLATRAVGRGEGL